ncbi:hypothetical protein [Pseudomonas aeruginosa]|uniref:hypothetical protein n=1 Tax=Pseudomonas aeruginosa TaxID=287 RepID=UPI001FBB47AE|nr:hypothetical protein [Pseudomonas aeruginosa]
MSSTQHQLIEQCATRLRGIVEALDNIHDTSPQRWSTDLDDVHSSAESLLAMIKDQAPARSEASFEEWLANELEGEDGQPVPAAVCDIALARRAFNHWPKLEQPAKVGGVRFSAGVSSRLVVEAAQRLYEFESTPEQEAERIERLQAFREQLDPLNLAPHAKAFNEAPAEALKSEQAEAERPEVVAHVDGSDEDWFIQPEDETELHNEGLLFAGCELGRMVDFDRIVGELRAEIAMLRQHKNDYMDSGQETYRALQNEIREREAEIARLDGLVSGRTAERDAALARVAELEKQEPVATVAKVPGEDWNGLHFYRDLQGMLPGTKLYTTPVAQAQHSVPDHAELLQALERTHAGHMVGHDQSDQPKGGYSDGYVNGFGECIKVARKVLAAAPGREVPQAWLDVQAERRRQVEAEGWTPEHDDEHNGGELADAAACYALSAAGWSTYAARERWPWPLEWWKPSTARRDLVKACALALAEIERLDRAGISQNPQPGATTASS